ncbi:hypothetical protein AB0O07_34660 [Streptomyces sp. NPDC093085]|uniref:hypothetical protein n=1 Tax=Streptomyces sp. NPDC093085 TaxID=3155068 RepID=UPI00343EE084
MNDRVLWGVVALTGSLIVLVMGILYVWYGVTPHRPRGVTPRGEPESYVPVDAEPGYTYTCHCYREPVLVTIRVPHIRHRRGHGRRAPRGW